MYALLPGFLKSPKDSIAVAKAEISVLLSSVMPLEARMCTGQPGSGFGIGVGVLVVLAVCWRICWLGAKRLAPKCAGVGMRV